MNKHAWILLATVVSMLTLSACRSDTDNRDDTAEHSTMEQGDLADNGISPPGEDILGDGVVSEHGDGLRDDLDHAKDDVKNDVKNDMTDTKDHLDDGMGVPFEDMLDNAHVHDSDGILTDGENAKHDDFLS